MRFENTDVAALVFGQELYAAMADGYPIDAALAQARLAVFSNDNDVEWGTPVLYLRARDGRIFDVPHEAHLAAPPTEVHTDVTLGLGGGSDSQAATEAHAAITEQPLNASGDTGLDWRCIEERSMGNQPGIQQDLRTVGRYSRDPTQRVLGPER